MFLKYLSEHKSSFMIYIGILIIYCAMPGYIDAEEYINTEEYIDAKENIDAILYSFVETDICQIHNLKMSAKNVRILYGLLMDEYFTYYKIRIKLFPHCDDPEPAFSCVVGNERYVEKYVCKDCNIDRDNWKKDNNWR